MPKIVHIDNIDEKEIVKKIKEGAIFIYPTDTVYGIGCNALDVDAVNKLRKIKQRENKPFSIIAPNKSWIFKNFFANKTYIEKFPGPFTFIVKKKNNLIPKIVSATEKVGLRMPNHKFTKTIQKSKTPFITTSVNLSGQNPIKDVYNIPPEIKDQVDYIVIDKISGSLPSSLIDLTTPIPTFVKRKI